MSQNNIHFEISERKILLRVIDILFILVVLYLTRLAFDFDYFKVSFENWSAIIVLVIYFSIFGSIFELYDLPKSSRFDATLQNVILAVLVTVLFYLLTPVYTPTLPGNRLQILFFFFAIAFALLLSRFFYVTLLTTPRFHKRVLLIASGNDIASFIDALQKSDPSYCIVGVFDTSGENKYLPNDIRRVNLETLEKEIIELNISEVVVAIHAGAGIASILSKKLLNLLEIGVTVRSFSSAYEDLTQRIPIYQAETDFYNYFPFNRSNRNKLYLFFNRLIDIVVSVLGIMGTVILLPFILTGNAIGNRGPLFYNQMRVGKNGKHFKLYKLRSMIVNAEKDGAQFSQKGDLRITKFGKILRRMRIDESPQFFNVLRGEMSLIGPRPERPEFVSLLNESIPFYEVRHVIKPGITGWAQVKSNYGENELDSLEKLQYDLYYIKHRSVLLDLVIVIKTLSIIVFFRGQ